MIEQAVNLSATSFSNTLKNIRERFVSTLTHDLKTPVTSAMLEAQLILRKTEDVNHCKKAVVKIIGSMHRLDQMIADLLDASRLGAGEKIDLIFENVDLDLLILEVVSSCEQVYGNRFHYKSPGKTEGHWSLDGLRRVLENLLSNAAKYSYPKTPITITLMADNDNAKFSIHNFGETLTKEDQDLIFEQFRRLNRNNEQKGWGIGLLLVKGIVDGLKGHLTVESQPASGIIFSVEIPINLHKINGLNHNNQKIN